MNWKLTCKFVTGKLTVAGECSLTAYVASMVTRIDFISEEFACWDFPPDTSDVVELSEEEFHQVLHQNGMAQMEKREKPQTPGAFAVRFLHVEMLGGQQVFLAIEFVVELPVERLNKIHFLLSAPAIILIFLKRYLKINCTGDGIQGGLDADCLVRKGSQLTSMTRANYSGQNPLRVRDIHRQP